MDVSQISNVLKHRAVIRDKAREDRGDAQKAWKETQKAVSGIDKYMDFEDFLLCAALLITLGNDAEKAIDEKEEAIRAQSETRIKDLERLEKEKEESDRKLNKLLQDNSDLEQKIKSLEAELEQAKEALNSTPKTESISEESEDDQSEDAHAKGKKRAKASRSSKKG